MMHNAGKDVHHPLAQPVTDNLARRLEGYIAQKACGRIRGLHVVCSHDRIVLQGHSRTHHAKQLAQQAALDLTDGHAVSLANEIIVS